MFDWQGVEAEAPELEKDPAGTFTHEEDPELAEIVPAGHGFAAVEPLKLSYDPGGVAAHTDCPVEAEKEPGRHAV